MSSTSCWSSPPRTVTLTLLILTNPPNSIRPYKALWNGRHALLAVLPMAPALPSAASKAVARSNTSRRRTLGTGFPFFDLYHTKSLCSAPTSHSNAIGKPPQTFAISQMFSLLMPSHSILSTAPLAPQEAMVRSTFGTRMPNTAWRAIRKLAVLFQLRPSTAPAAYLPTLSVTIGVKVMRLTHLSCRTKSCYILYHQMSVNRGRRLQKDEGKVVKNWNGYGFHRFPALYWFFCWGRLQFLSCSLLDLTICSYSKRDMRR